MKNKKGFTLIELLAVIIILAVIALIAVPQIIKILNKSRLAAAEDSTYGVVSSTDSYIGNLMLKNDGSYPKEDLEFNCDNGSCQLNDEIRTKLSNYNLTGLEELNFKGSNPKGGKVIITNGGKTTIVKNLEINGFICSYPIDGKAKCVRSGEELEEPDISEPPKPIIINITIIFNAMGGNIDIDSKEVIYNEKYGELPNPTKENYEFVGWYTMPTYTKKVTSETVVSAKENQTLYAKWEGITTTVKFDANGGVGETPSKKVTYGEKYGELPVVTREGYKFAGWYTEIKGGTRITSDTIVSDAKETTLYAYWVGENSTITFNAMGGSVTPISKEVTYGEKIGELPTPSRANYIFGGWYTLPTYTNEVTSTTIVSTNENQTLYAKWIEEVCNNTTKNVSCTKTCKNGASASGTRTDTYNCHGNLVSTGVCNANCSNYTKNNSCTKTCANGSVSGTRVDTYNGNTGSLISTGTCNATCSNYTKSNSCTKTCANGSISGTRVDTYNGNTGSLISTGTCNAICPNYTTTNSCSINCNNIPINGTIRNTYNGETGVLISAGTCDAKCPSGSNCGWHSEATVATACQICPNGYISIPNGSCGPTGSLSVTLSFACSDGKIIGSISGCS